MIIRWRAVSGLGGFWEAGAIEVEDYYTDGAISEFVAKDALSVMEVEWAIAERVKSRAPVETAEGLSACGMCGEVLERNEAGDMPDWCPRCGEAVEWDKWKQPPDPFDSTVPAGSVWHKLPGGKRD
jgi:hypothetical protein